MAQGLQHPLNKLQMKQIPTTETPRLLQDEAEGYETQRLSKWFASRIDARETIRRNFMKHYIGEVETYFGESEVSTMIKFKTDSHPDEYLDKVASDFWGNEGEQIGDETVSIYDFGDKNASAGRWQEIDADMFNKLTLIVEIVR